MPAQDYYETSIPNETIDTSASNRKFQTSIIITQDKNKSGILSFLEKIEETAPPLPTRRPGTTVRPRRGDGY